MDMERLDKAMAEAQRFLDRAEEAWKKRESDRKADSIRLDMLLGDSYENVSKENAACKRASLDLTRALANLRSSK